jgi:hypothetical protein
LAATALPAGQHGSIAVVERFIRTLKEKFEKARGTGTPRTQPLGA